MTPTSKGIPMNSTGNQHPKNVALNKLMTQHQDSVYRQMVRVSQSRKNADADLLKALLEAHADLHRLDPVGGYREWLVKTTRLCLMFFSDENAPCKTSSGRRTMRQKPQ